MEDIPEIIQRGNIQKIAADQFHKKIKSDGRRGQIHEQNKKK